MVESNTLQEVFPIPYLGSSPSLQESESNLDSTINIPNNLPLEQIQRSPIVYRRRPQIADVELEGNERLVESCPTPADNKTKIKSPSIALCNTRTVDKSIHDMYIFDDNLGGA